MKVNSLATPAVPKVTNGKDGAVVTWTAVKNAETYSVWRKTSSTGWKKLATVEGTTYTDKTAESNQTYYYTIRCMNAGKNICTSDYNRTGTKAYYLAASNISSLTLTSNGIAVKWNKVAAQRATEFTVRQQAVTQESVLLTAAIQQATQIQQQKAARLILTL